jgi:hypothetical protein
MNKNQLNKLIVWLAIAVSLAIGIYLWQDASYQAAQTEEVLFPHAYTEGWPIIHAMYAIAFYKIVLLGGWLLLSVSLLLRQRQPGPKS